MNPSDTTPTSDLFQYRQAGRQLVYDLIKELVSDHTSVSVEVEVGERTTIYRVACGKSCIGQILGSKGRNITAIRTLIASISARKGFRAIVEIPYFSE